MEGQVKARIIFMGTPDFAVPTLNALVEAGHTVVAVVTAPDRPAGRGRLPRASAVKVRATELGLPVWQPERLKDPGFLEQLHGAVADLYVVVAFRMLPREVWARPRLGTINLHASLLPQYRGAAPINRAIINGEQRSGLTTFVIGEDIDTGDLLMQEAMDIGPDETAGELHDRMMAAGAVLVTRTVRGLLDGTLRPMPQQATGELRTAPKLHAGTGGIDPRRSVRAVHDLVRGLSPYPGAWARLHGGGRLKVLRTAPSGDHGAAAPGEVHAVRGRPMLRCADGWLELVEVQAEGRRRTSGADLLRGLHGRSDGPAVMHLVPPGDPLGG
ncbi:MAG: methionyl-tRNA formyltransferase [Flavobacteriales bacterium]|jgi:methionyl-tRNA formyltransferase|nr:methionyl-tRNA formyltransferase [Flavobacteriales bacterium]